MKEQVWSGLWSEDLIWPFHCHPDPYAERHASPHQHHRMTSGWKSTPGSLFSFTCLSWSSYYDHHYDPHHGMTRGYRRTPGSDPPTPERTGFRGQFWRGGTHRQLDKALLQKKCIFLKHFMKTSETTAHSIHPFARRGQFRGDAAITNGMTDRCLSWLANLFN